MTHANSIYNRFETVANDAHAGVHPIILEAGRGTRIRFGYELGHPTPMIGAFAAAAMLLRQDPDTVLTRQPVPVEAFPEDTMSRMLATMVNGTIEPIDSSRLGFMGGKAVMHACLWTEYNWHIIMEAAPHEQPGVEIYLDEAGEPAILRKAVGRGSGLTLRPTTIIGREYPALSLVRLRALQDEPVSQDPDAFLRLAADKVVVRPTTDIASLSFLRPSIFALPPEERSVHFRDNSKQTPMSLLDPYTAATITDTVRTFLT